MDVEKESLVVQMMQRLELDHGYEESVPAYDDDRIDLVRTVARVAARRLGWKVRTFARDGENGLTYVIVVVIESTPEDQERIRERGAMLLRRALDEGP